MAISQIPSEGNWGNVASLLNDNFRALNLDTEKAKDASTRSKGLFKSEGDLTASCPNPTEGDWAIVGESVPGTIYRCESRGTWKNTGQTGGGEQIDLNGYVKEENFQIVNNFFEGGSSKVLSAEMGKQLGSELYGNSGSMTPLSQSDFHYRTSLYPDGREAPNSASVLLSKSYYNNSMFFDKILRLTATPRTDGNRWKYNIAFYDSSKQFIRRLNYQEINKSTSLNEGVYFRLLLALVNKAGQDVELNSVSKPALAYSEVSFVLPSSNVGGGGLVDRVTKLEQNGSSVQLEQIEQDLYGTSTVGTISFSLNDFMYRHSIYPDGREAPNSPSVLTTPVYYELSKLPNRTITLNVKKRTDGNRWKFNVALYDSNNVFQERMSYLETNQTMQLNGGFYFRLMLALVNEAGNDVELNSVTAPALANKEVTMQYMSPSGLGLVSRVESLEGAENTAGKLRFMSWNIGHFCGGAGPDSTINNSTYEYSRRAYTALFNKYSPDVCALAEYSKVFNPASGKTASDAIFFQFAKKHIGTSSGYMCIAFHYNLIRLSSVQEIQLGGNYYILEGRTSVLGANFIIAMCHLPWQSLESNRGALNTIADRYREESHVILGGDFNILSGHRADFNILKDAGFSLANYGDFGTFETHMMADVSDTVLDNIAVKGCRIVKVEIPISVFIEQRQIENKSYIDKTDLEIKIARDYRAADGQVYNLSDHLPVICDLVAE